MPESSGGTTMAPWPTWPSRSVIEYRTTWRTSVSCTVTDVPLVTLAPGSCVATVRSFVLPSGS